MEETNEETTNEETTNEVEETNHNKKSQGLFFLQDKCHWLQLEK